MATRVLIINRQLVFAVTLKQALEQTGTFDVHPFTTADAAFEYLRDHPQDVALVDFALPGRSGAKVIQQLRGIQADLAVIISPRQPDADVLMNSLRLQGMIDMPFGARDVIPLIEQALEQIQQSPLDNASEPVWDEPAQGGTRILGETPSNPSQQFGTTRNLGGDAQQSEYANEPAQTRNLGQSPEPDAPNPYPTRDSSEDDGAQNLYKTRNFEEDSAVPPPATPYPAQTRNLDLDGEPPASTVKPSPGYGETRDLGEDEPPPPVQSSRRQSAQTRDVDPQNQESPAPPEISSLENVLRSFGFDPPLGEEDTPAVPMSDNEALRQFLATVDSPANSEQFDDVLGAIDPKEHEEPSRQESDFDALVKSMKSGEIQRGLPDRQQQLLDFVFTSGMDSVLQEIEKTKTGPLPEQPTTIPEQPRERGKKSSFQKLAKEEPPIPSLEEGGTVSDLMLGVSDRGFRNVLSLLRGDEVDENEPNEKLPPPRLERHERFADFFNPVTGPQDLGEEPEDPAQVQSLPVRQPSPSAPESIAESYDFDHFPEADEEATVAQVILKTALEDLNLPEGFSLNQLLTDIENRLSLHKLNVKPLPSWLMDTGAFRPVTEMEIREPDFLPEEMPPGEEVNEAAALEFEEPENVTGHTTRPSLASQQTLGVFPEDADTLFDAKFIKATMAPPAFSEEEPQEAEPEPDSLPDWPDAEEITVPETFVEPPDAVLPEWLPETPSVPVDADTEGFPIEHLPEETAPSLAFSSESGTIPESETVLSGDTWDISIVPDDQQSTWDEAPTDDEIAAVSEEQAEFESALEGWSLQPEAQDASDWDTEPPVEETADEWLQPGTQDTGDQWSVQPEPEGEMFNETEGVPTDFYAESVPADVSWDLPVEEGQQEAFVPEDPYIAQLALNLTQFSLESSSEGSLLTRGEEVVAYAGHLSDEDAAELRDAVNNDWDANPQGARIRFITLPSSGKDYMLYSIHTDNELTLSMIFAGTTPLRVIRQQGQKLIAALESIPDVVVEEAPAPEVVEAESAPQESALVPLAPQVDEALLNPYTYVWLLRDAEGQLTEAVAQSIMSGLRIQLRESGWSIRTLQVHEDFVYLYAGVPGETPPHEIMRDLKRRSAEIAHAQNSDITPQMLWADAYLILTPGRELETEEILEFVNFQRMA